MRPAAIESHSRRRRRPSLGLGLAAIGIAVGSLVLAHEPTVARGVVLVVVTAIVAAGVMAGGRMQGWRIRVGWLGLVVVVAATVALVGLGWWAPVEVIPGIAIGVAAVEADRTGVARPRWGWLALGAVLLIASPWLWSFETAVTANNSDPLSVRSVEWVREHGGASIVDDVEHWWYTRHPPPVGGKPKELTSPTPAAVRGARGDQVPIVDPGLARIPTPATHAIGTEGQWVVTAGSTSRPAVATTLVRPDAIHTSLVVGVLRIDPSAVRLRLLSGTEQPGGPSVNGAMVPLADRSHLLAVFNAGFRLNESHGGWYSDGHTVGTLQRGAASLVFYDDGRADVGVWGRDDSMGPHVAAVRQNLALIVDGGRAVPGIDDSANALWGKTVGHKVLVSRSGIGITSTGALVYVGGPGMSVQTLANTLLAAGAVRAMELDINTTWVEAFTFHQGSSGPIGTKLVDAMFDPPTHYFAPETRDFIEVLDSSASGTRPLRTDR